MISTASITLFEGLDDPRLTSDWPRLLDTGRTQEVFLTQPYQLAWWESFGRGRLLSIGVKGDDALTVLAPLFADQGMVYFVGSGGSDYLDFVGRPDAESLASILAAVADSVDGFLGCVFYHVSDESTTGRLLQQAAERLGWDCFEEGSQLAPRLFADSFEAAANRKRLVHHENWFRNHGELRVQSLRAAKEIAPHLDEFFSQHESRWAETSSPSLFLDPAQRMFYRRLVDRLAPEGGLRFSRLEWDGRPIAFHFGFSFGESFLLYKPSFDVELSKRSPGIVLLRALFLEAASEGAQVFDFGLGDEPFKRRFCSDARRVRNWGLYPRAGASRS